MLIHFQNAFSARLAKTGHDYHSLAVPDIMHDFELNVWKRFFKYLLRLLHMYGGDATQSLDER